MCEQVVASPILDYEFTFSGLQTCTTDRLVSVGRLHADFALQERAVDNYVELLRTVRQFAMLCGDYGS